MDLSNLEVDVAHSGGIGQQISKAGLLVGQWNLGRGGVGRTLVVFYHRFGTGQGTLRWCVALWGCERD